MKIQNKKIKQIDFFGMSYKNYEKANLPVADRSSINCHIVEDVSQLQSGSTPHATICGRNSKFKNNWPSDRHNNQV